MFGGVFDSVWASEIRAWGRAGIWEVEGLLFLLGVARRESLYEESWLRGTETPRSESTA